MSHVALGEENLPTPDLAHNELIWSCTRDSECEYFQCRGQVTAMWRYDCVPQIRVAILAFLKPNSLFGGIF